MPNETIDPAARRTAPEKAVLTPNDQEKSNKARAIEAKQAADAQHAKPAPGRIDQLRADYEKAAAAVNSSTGLQESDPVAYAKLRDAKRKAASAFQEAEQQQARESHKK